MSSDDLAISVRDLSKRYDIVHKGARHATLAETILHAMRHPFRRMERESFFALRDIHFDLHRGDVLGVVGRNGAGKSTLLKLLSRITEPTTGTIDLYGPVGSLLEVGTGFHPELTGRENIFLNGAVLGMRRRDIQRQFDAIVDFAGVEKFLDTPVKRYSSGMYIRLAFAVAAHLNPEILIIDEVLSVGDAEFQNKCLGKMHQVSQGEGRTVLFVSHNMAAVRELCNRAIYLESGRVVAHGDTQTVLEAYTTSRQAHTSAHQTSPAGLALLELTLADARTAAPTDSPIFNHDYLLHVRLRAHRPLTYASIRIRIFDDLGAKVSSIYSTEEGIPPLTLDGELHIAYRLPRLSLFPGRYRVYLEVARPNDPMKYLAVDDALIFEVQPECLNDATWAYNKNHGIARIADGGQVLPSRATDFAAMEKD